MTTEAQIYALGNLPNSRNAPKTHRSPNKPPNQPKLSTNYIVIITNKPNFLDDQMNVKSLEAVDYENIANCKLGKNKPNTNPIQSQTKPIKANKMPIQTQNKPNQTQFQRLKMLLIFTLLEVLATSVGRRYYLEQHGTLNHRRLP